MSGGLAKAGLIIIGFGLVAGCEPVPGGGAPGKGGGGAVVVDQGGQKISVDLATLGVNCPDGALSPADCAKTTQRAKVTRVGTAFGGTEDERAAARLAIGKACEARGQAPGRFTLTDGNYQSGIWVFDDACS